MEYDDWPPDTLGALRSTPPDRPERILVMARYGGQIVIVADRVSKPGDEPCGYHVRGYRVHDVHDSPEAPSRALRNILIAIEDDTSNGGEPPRTVRGVSAIEICGDMLYLIA